MGDLGSDAGPNTLGEVAAAIDALLDGLRRHEATYADVLRETPTGEGQDSIAWSKVAEVAATDDRLARAADAVRHWLGRHRDWSSRLGGAS